MVHLTPQTKIRNFELEGEAALDRSFPKGKCKERGRALVLWAEIALTARKYFRMERRRAKGCTCDENKCIACNIMDGD
jgi:hypothetical protein